MGRDKPEFHFRLGGSINNLPRRPLNAIASRASSVRSFHGHRRCHFASPRTPKSETWPSARRSIAGCRLSGRIPKPTGVSELSPGALGSHQLPHTPNCTEWGRSACSGESGGAVQRVAVIRPCNARLPSAALSGSCDFHLQSSSNASFSVLNWLSILRTAWQRTEGPRPVESHMLNRVPTEGVSTK